LLLQGSGEVVRTENNKIRSSMAGAALHQPGAEPVLPASKARGFSLVELLIVMAVLLIVGAIATPTIATTMDAYRMRGTLSGITSLTQRCRLLALKKNSTAHMFVTTSNGSVVMYCKELTDASAMNSADPQMQLPVQFSIPGLPTGGPTQLTANAMWGSSGSTFSANSDPYFNSRGLPCNAVNIGSPCTSVTGYVYYFKYTRNGAHWTALSVSPASRIQNWFWNGTSWGN
jgi:prepilin-type N-terminal cleavage/methylation domain-containing protein